MNKQSIISLFFLLCILIMLSISSTTRAQLVNDTKVNDDTSYTTQNQASLGVDGIGNFVVVWADWRHQTEEIYCQLFNYRGQKIGDNFLIVSSGHSPCIAMRKDGSFGLSWIDTMPKFRLFNKFGIPISGTVVLDNSLFLEGQSPSISCDTSGNFVVVFQRKITLTNINLYCQLLDSNGNKIGGNKKINDDSLETIKHQHPVVTKRRDGSFIAAWHDYRSPSIGGSDDIYMQIFDKLGNKIGANTRVNNDTVQLDFQTLPQISSDDLGRFAIVFTETLDYSGSTYNLLQLYNTDGSPNGNNIRYSNNGSEQYPYIAKRKNGDMVISFSRESGANYLPYTQRLYFTGSLYGSSFLVTNQYLNSIKGTSAISLFDEKIITAFVDYRYGTADVFINIRSFINPDSVTVVQQLSFEIPDQCELFQNYPNPFNPSTTIKFAIPKNGVVQIKLYDITGREVKSLVNELKTAGYYSITFNASDLSSGVYFYRIQANDFVQTRRMVLIK